MRTRRECDEKRNLSGMLLSATALLLMSGYRFRVISKHQSVCQQARLDTFKVRTRDGVPALCECVRGMDSTVSVQRRGNIRIGFQNIYGTFILSYYAYLGVELYLGRVWTDGALILFVVLANAHSRSVSQWVRHRGR